MLQLWGPEWMEHRELKLKYTNTHRATQSQAASPSPPSDMQVTSCAWNKSSALPKWSSEEKFCNTACWCLACPICRVYKVHRTLHQQANFTQHALQQNELTYMPESFVAAQFQQHLLSNHFLISKYHRLFKIPNVKNVKHLIQEKGQDVQRIYPLKQRRKCGSKGLWCHSDGVRAEWRERK